MLQAVRGLWGTVRGNLITAQHAASGDNESGRHHPMNPLERAMLPRP